MAAMRVRVPRSCWDGVKGRADTSESPVGGSGCFRCVDELTAEEGGGQDDFENDYHFYRIAKASVVPGLGWGNSIFLVSRKIDAGRVASGNPTGLVEVGARFAALLVGDAREKGV